MAGEKLAINAIHLIWFDKDENKVNQMNSQNTISDSLIFPGRYIVYLL